MCLEATDVLPLKLVCDWFVIVWKMPPGAGGQAPGPGEVGMILRGKTLKTFMIIWKLESIGLRLALKGWNNGPFMRDFFNRKPCACACIYTRIVVCIFIYVCMRESSCMWVRLIHCIEHLVSLFKHSTLRYNCLSILLSFHFMCAFDQNSFLYFNKPFWVFFYKIFASWKQGRLVFWVYHFENTFTLVRKHYFSYSYFRL